jgi:alpha-ribazole phosphatase
MEIYIIRHTQVAVGKDTCYGQTNVPLADTFEAEVAQYKQALPTDFDAIYSSPMQRCKDLVNGLDYPNATYLDQLMELNFGDWEGQKWADINAEQLNIWMLDFVMAKTPNGENLFEMNERVQSFLNHLRTQEHKKVLIVAHAGVIRCVWAYLLAIPLQNIFKIPVDHNEVFVFKLSQSESTDRIIKTK